MKKYAQRPFVLLGVNSDASVAKLKSVVKREKISWRSWYDGGTRGPIASRWNIQSFPTIYVLDHRGVIRYKNVCGEALEQAVESLVIEAEARPRNR